ncbi:MAG: carboxypeptidase-like regulatory domain-containing protein [Gemmatimonadota bacterium]|jgi:hypothetical protein|nr:carboxypeptidase-like regulatory domain-containing protein [Gemmatimonadota bacterium]
MNPFTRQLAIASLAPLILLTASSCRTRLISAPGIEGRFLEESTGIPIAGAKVKYTSIGDGVTKESLTDADGRFRFLPEFTQGYAGYPSSPVGLRVRIQLMMKDAHNFSAVFPSAKSSSHPSVKNTDIDNAMIKAGDIRVNRFFLDP